MGLADTGIKKAKPRQRPYSMSDGGGLYLWITPAGGKLWRWSYRYESKEKLMSLGKYPDVSLGQARERHSEARKLLAEGVDPMAQRKAAKTAEKAAVENSSPAIHNLHYLATYERMDCATCLPCIAEPATLK